MADEVRDFLNSNNLSGYAEKFIDFGYDDLLQLQNMSTADLVETMKDVGLNNKPGHQKRFVAALQILRSQTKRGVPQPDGSSSDDSHKQDLPSCSTVNTAEHVDTWPAPARELWIPNPLTEQFEYYNQVLVELYQAIYGLIPPMQFKEYALSQRRLRWRQKKETDAFIRSHVNLLSPECKDGNGINVQAFSRPGLSTFHPGDIAKASRAQDTVEKLLAKGDELTHNLSQSRSSLFSTNNEVKAWRANELSFYDGLLDELQAAKLKLQAVRSNIITNVNNLTRRVSKKADVDKETQRKKKRTQENTKKSQTRKRDRLVRSASEMVNVITEGRVSFKDIESGICKITRADLCEAPRLVPRFHLNGLSHLIAKGAFDDESSERAEEWLQQLKKMKIATSAKNESKKKLKQGKRQCTLDALFSKKPSTSSTAKATVVADLTLSSGTSSDESDE